MKKLPTEKIPISFNEQDIKQVEELAYLMFGGDVYGGFPKAVRFGINLALSCVKNPNKVYTDLEDAELDFYFSSIKRAEIKARLTKKSQEIAKEALKV